MDFVKHLRLTRINLSQLIFATIRSCPVLRFFVIALLYCVEWLFVGIAFLFKPIFFIAERIERIPHIRDLPPALQKKFLIYFYFTNHFR